MAFHCTWLFTNSNLYMEFFEELALQSAPSRPRFWKRYVDDTCCIMEKDEVEPLLNHLNSVRTTIKFTMELERDGSLPFLDTKLTRREGGALDVTVFRKPTHTDRYLHFSSHHPASAKRAAVRSLFDRARNVTLRKENLREEEDHLTTTFKQNGYPLGPYPSSVPSPLPYRNHQRHRRRSRMRSQTTKDPRRMRGNHHWQSSHT